MSETITVKEIVVYCVTCGVPIAQTVLAVAHGVANVGVDAHGHGCDHD